MNGFLTGVAAFLFFSLSDAIIKDVGKRLELLPLAMLLAFASTSTILIIALGLGKLSALKTQRIGIHLIRGSLFLFCALAVFYALPRIPLAQFYAMNFTMPFWAVIMGMVIFRIPIRLREMVALLIGFSGVLMAIKPDDFLVSPGLIVMLFVPIMLACTLVLSKSVPQTDSPLTLAFYPQGLSVITLLIPSIYSLEQWPLLADIAMIALSGMLQGGAMILSGLAFQRSSPAVAAFAQYSQAIWGGLLGLIFFAEVPSSSTIMGLSIIIAAGALLHKAPT